MDDSARRRQQILAAMGIQAWIRRDFASPAPLADEPQRSVTQPGQKPPVQKPEAQWIQQPAKSIPDTVLSGNDTASLDWNALQQQVIQCTACPLHKTRTQTVFGVGNRHADWMLIGEAPGADEDRQGEPFVGRAGQLLNAMLYAVGLKRGQVYIANILKCRPPRNRDPEPEETERCEKFLLRQVQLVKPKLILALGRIAAQNLLKTDISIGRLRGRPFNYGADEVPLVVTYHPAYLLRSPREKRKAWDDLKLAKSIVQG
jgi:uracil-DNA glycosylase family 4